MVLKFVFSSNSGAALICRHFRQQNLWPSWSYLEKTSSWSNVQNTLRGWLQQNSVIKRLLDILKQLALNNQNRAGVRVFGTLLRAIRQSKARLQVQSGYHCFCKTSKQLLITQIRPNQMLWSIYIHPSMMKLSPSSNSLAGFGPWTKIQLRDKLSTASKWHQKRTAWTFFFLANLMKSLLAIATFSGNPLPKLLPCAANIKLGQAYHAKFQTFSRIFWIQWCHLCLLNLLLRIANVSRTNILQLNFSQKERSQMWAFLFPISWWVASLNKDIRWVAATIDKRFLRSKFSCRKRSCFRATCCKLHVASKTSATRRWWVHEGWNAVRCVVCGFICDVKLLGATALASSDRMKWTVPHNQATRMDVGYVYPPTPR